MWQEKWSVTISTQINISRAWCRKSGARVTGGRPHVCELPQGSLLGHKSASSSSIFTFFSAINPVITVPPCNTSTSVREAPTPVIGEKPILSFETRSRIVFFQSRASRRERDFVHRISSLETRSRILFTESRASRRDREFCSPNLEIRDEIEIFRSFYQNILVRKKDFSHKRSNITVQLEEEEGS